MLKKSLICTVILLLAASVGTVTASDDLTPIEELGKKLFFDENLSATKTQSCATCHAPETGFTGPDSFINAGEAVYPGALDERSGNRKPPTAAYGGDSPVLRFDLEEEVWIGGMFWDGRATGWTLGDPLAEQAQGPFLNPLEQALPNAKSVCKRVAESEYADLFEEVWGPGSLDFINDVEGTYERIARSIAAYERSTEVNPFSSKYDAYLAGKVKLTKQEALGLKLFNNPNKGNCAACHPSKPGSDGEPPLFTDFTYDNLGVPKNPDNPFYSMPPKWNPDGMDWIDPGLGGFLSSLPEEYFDDIELVKDNVVSENYGKHKVPTLRNVDLRPDEDFVKAYGHNGYFKTLKGIVNFYNTRDVKPMCAGDYTEAEALAAGCWPAPEVADNVNTDELGDLGLTEGEENAIVAFLKTLSDGYIPPED